MSRKKSDRQRSPEPADRDARAPQPPGEAGMRRSAQENRDEPAAADGLDVDGEDLSALLDGELEPERAQVLRRRLSEEPALAARWAELGELTGQLQMLAHSEDGRDEASSEEAARLDRIHGALRVRLAGEAVLEEEAAEEEARDEAAAGQPRAQVIPLRPLPAWLGPAAAALAASLALYWAAGNFGGGVPGTGLDDVEPGGGEPAASQWVAETVPPAPAEPAPQLEPAPVEIVRDAPSPTEPGAVLETLPDEEAQAVEAWAAVDLAEADEEELAIAFELDVLADFDVIENLELLELLDELDTLERI
jgi:anti-sigma factor RsiW